MAVQVGKPKGLAALQAQGERLAQPAKRFWQIVEAATNWPCLQRKHLVLEQGMKRRHPGRPGLDLGGTGFRI
jgi:hypothetical protein